MNKHPHLTTIDEDGWELDDGEVAHAQTPDKYWIPELSARESLIAGDLAKVRFYIRTEDSSGEVVDNGERMWVLVSSRVDAWYEGVLDNDPCCTTGIAAGMPLWFEPRHVIDIRRREP